MGRLKPKIRGLNKTIFHFPYKRFHKISWQRRQFKFQDVSFRAFIYMTDHKVSKIKSLVTPKHQERKIYRKAVLALFQSKIETLITDFMRCIGKSS